MAQRTNLPITTLDLAAATTRPAGTAIDATNAHRIQVQGDLAGLVIEVTNTFAGAKVCCVRAGDNPPALRAGVQYAHGLTTAMVKGGAVTPADAAASIAQNATAIFILESARHIKAPDSSAADAPATEVGNIYIDTESGMTGTVNVYRLPTEAL